MLYVFKDNQQWGPYTQEQLNEYISAGNFHLDDLVCGEGQAEWVPARQFFPPPPPEQHSPTQTALPEAAILIGSNSCLNCGKAVEPQQVICVTCGFNLKTGTSTSIKTGETQRSEESIRHDHALKKYERLVSIFKRVTFALIILIVLMVILFIYKEWDLGPYILYCFIPFPIMLGTIIVYKFALSMMLIPKSNRVKLVLYVLLTYIIAVASIIIDPWSTFFAVPIVWLAPHFFRTGIPRLNGIHERDWPVDTQEGWHAEHGPYQQQIWNEGKLISFKQWDRIGRSMPLEKFGYNLDGTTDAPLTKMPLKYRLYLEPFTSWLIWETIKTLPKTVFKFIWECIKAGA